MWSALGLAVSRQGMYLVAVVGVKVASRGYRLAAAPLSVAAHGTPAAWRVLLCPMCVA
jgi:hypothetical protein